MSQKALQFHFGSLICEIKFSRKQAVISWGNSHILLPPFDATNVITNWNTWLRASGQKCHELICQRRNVTPGTDTRREQRRHKFPSQRKKFQVLQNTLKITDQRESLTVSEERLQMSCRVTRNLKQVYKYLES